MAVKHIVSDIGFVDGGNYIQYLTYGLGTSSAGASANTPLTSMLLSCIYSCIQPIIPTRTREED